ncbi:MAG: DUF1361 domain-containing protein [Bacteroidota bacterium]
MINIQKIINLFQQSRRFRLFVLLCLSTLFNFLLIGGRLHHLGVDLQDIATTKNYGHLRGSTTFLFLIWNLFLAWIPYLIALSLEGIHQWFGKNWITGLTILAWLFFFPNAPYILTDLLHLRSRAPIPIWYDMMVISSFAWTGLMLGLLSLYEIQLFLRRRFSVWLTWTIVGLCIAACGYGVYLGRYLRWNTWDVLANPLSLFKDILQTFTNPVLSKGMLEISGVLTVFLLLAYLMTISLIGKEDKQQP